MAGPYQRLPRPPVNDDKTQWGIWFNEIYKMLSGIPGLSWGTVSKTGSSLTDLATRNHSDLQNIGEADDTDTDGTHDKHVSNAQIKVYKDHTLDSTIHHTFEEIQDDIATFLVQGNAITLTYSDAGNTLTVAVNKIAAQADSTATDVAGLKSDFNGLLAKMRTAGHLAT